MLISHTVNFLMYVYWRMHIQKYPLVKFEYIRDDGTIEVPNRVTLKWVLPYYFRMTEKQGAAMYALTAVFCVIGLYVPG
jgi:UDP-N-acetylglucosamine--dolichyl-phosphate N-acetylglucosaminephosphotransferase